MVKAFDFYLNEGKVKRCSADLALANSLYLDSTDRYSQVSQLSVDSFGKIIFENVYDALRDILDAILACDGYKSYSHEASIAYLTHFDIDSFLLDTLDSFRYMRNGSKYYGKQVPPDAVIRILAFYPQFLTKIRPVLKDKSISTP